MATQAHAQFSGWSNEQNRNKAYLFGKLSSPQNLPPHSPQPRYRLPQMLPNGRSFVNQSGQHRRNLNSINNNFLNHIDSSYANMWRYHQLMTACPNPPFGDQVGCTPIAYLPETSSALGIDLWVKLENTNPTGTFSDRGAAYLAAASWQRRQANLVLCANSNMAISLAHYTGRYQIPSWLFIPRYSAYKLNMPPKASTSHIIAVDGDDSEVQRVAADFARSFGFPQISAFNHCCAANVTLAYEVGEMLLTGELPEQERLQGSNFDYWVQPTATGAGLIGFQRGMVDLYSRTLGHVTIPKLLAVRLNELPPNASSDHNIFEPTLLTHQPINYDVRLRQALNETKGMLTSVTPSQVNAALAHFDIWKELAGLGHYLVDTEKAAFVGYAGLVEKIKLGEIATGSSVLLVMTGKGYPRHFIKQRPDLIVSPGKYTPQDIMASKQVTLSFGL